MAKRRMPELDATVRRYLTDTARARLAGPGIERFIPGGRRGRRALAIAAAFAVALLGFMLWAATRL